MQLVPLMKPPSGGLSRGWRALILLFAGLLAFGVLQPLTASASPNLLTVKDKTVVETDSGTSTAKVKIVLSQRAHKKVSVSYTTRDGTAKAGSDYIAKTGRVYFPKGTKVAFVRVAVVGDTLDESDEYFKVRIFDPFRAKIADHVGIVDVLDNDAPAPPPPPALPSLWVGDTKVDEGGTAHFKVYLSKVATQTVTFDFATSDGTAVAGKDYDAAVGSNKAIAVGEDHVWVSVQTREDDLYEGSEAFYLDVSDVHNATAVDSRGVGLILDDDKPLPKLSVSDETVYEGETVWFKVSLDHRAPWPVVFDATTLNGDAKAGHDYTALTTYNVVIPKGEFFVWVKVATIEDDDFEPTEAFYLKVFDVHGAAVLDDVGRATILDDDKPLPKLWVLGDKADEGTKVYFEVRLTAPAPHEVTFKYATSIVNGTAEAGDLTGVPEATSSIAKGDTSRIIAIQTTQDAVDEFDETFFLKVYDVHGAIVFDNIGKGTIVDDDAEPALKITKVAPVVEGHPALFDVTLSGNATEKTVTVNWAVVFGTGTLAADADDLVATAPKSGTLTFSPGDTTEQISIPTRDDRKDEPDSEFFGVVLSAAGNATLAAGDSSARGEILDNDLPPAP